VFPAHITPGGLVLGGGVGACVLRLKFIFGVEEGPACVSSFYFGVKLGKSVDYVVISFLESLM
jgi:hypothetical protein